MVLHDHELSASRLKPSSSLYLCLHSSHFCSKYQISSLKRDIFSSFTNFNSFIYFLCSSSNVSTTLPKSLRWSLLNSYSSLAFSLFASSNSSLNLATC